MLHNFLMISFLAAFVGSLRLIVFGLNRLGTSRADLADFPLISYYLVGPLINLLEANRAVICLWCTYDRWSKMSDWNCFSKALRSKSCKLGDGASHEFCSVWGQGEVFEPWRSGSCCDNLSSFYTFTSRCDVTVSGVVSYAL